MSPLTFLTLNIGPAIAKGLLTVLLHDHAILGQLAPKLLDLLQEMAENAYDRRVEQSRIMIIGEKIARQMQPLFDEAHLPDSERAILAGELALTLQQAQITSEMII